MFRKLNILKIFFEDPNKEYNVREISRIIKIAPATASKELKNLAQKGILKERKERIYNLYKANLESDYYKDLKLFYNIRKIKDSGLLKVLNIFYFKPTIILFGSASRGEDTKESDFDLLIVSEKTKEFNERTKFEKKINRNLQIFIIKNIKDLKNKHLINNILRGIVIQGELKWI